MPNHPLKFSPCHATAQRPVFGDVLVGAEGVGLAFYAVVWMF